MVLRLLSLGVAATRLQMPEARAVKLFEACEGIWNRRGPARVWGGMGCVLKNAEQEEEEEE